MTFNIHAHYDDEAFDIDREELSGSLRGAGITSVMNVATSLDSCVTAPKLAGTCDWMYAAQGIHPSKATEFDKEKIRWIESCCVHERVKVVEEIGLGYYWEELDYSIQEKWFVRQLDLVRGTKLLVIVHGKDVVKDTLDVMKAEKTEDMGGVIHCFSYGKEIAREYLNMGFSPGIGGVVAFNSTKKLRGVVEYAPLKSLMLETDCPYLVPMLNQSKRNSSLNLTYVMSAIGGIKGVDRDTVVKTARESVLRPYGISLIPTSDA